LLNSASPFLSFFPAALSSFSPLAGASAGSPSRSDGTEGLAANDPFFFSPFASTSFFIAGEADREPPPLDWPPSVLFLFFVCLSVRRELLFDRPRAGDVFFLFRPDDNGSAGWPHALGRAFPFLEGFSSGSRSLYTKSRARIPVSLARPP